MLLGFRRRFAPFVRDGSKTHTIRLRRKIRPRVGEICHCYVDPRQKTMELLGRWPCVAVEDIVIDGRSGLFEIPYKIIVAGAFLSDDEAQQLAWRDGFRENGPTLAFQTMMAYWESEAKRDQKRAFPFEGDLIHWRFS